MNKVKTLIVIMIFLTFVAYTKEYRYNVGPCTVIENTLKEIIDVEIIYNGYIKRSDMYMHVGENGWQNIRDIHGYRNSFILQVSRSTVSLEFCFFSGDIWDNNSGYDYKINLRGFLPDSFISSIGDSLAKYDIIRERYQKINTSIYYLENIKRSEDQTRQLNTLYELRDEALELLPEIMRKKDIKKNSDLELRYTVFIMKTEGL